MPFPTPSGERRDLIYRKIILWEIKLEKFLYWKYETEKVGNEALNWKPRESLPTDIPQTCPLTLSSKKTVPEALHVSTSHPVQETEGLVSGISEAS